MGRELKRVLLETLVVAALGLTFAVVANALSPRGLSITRNYFPATGRPAAGTVSGANTNVTASSHAADPAGHPALETVAARLKEKGLQPIDGKETTQLFRDPQREQELIVFVDARDDRHYQEGHIPGAYQFDRFYWEKHLPTLLPVCLNAMKIVVYCAGGNCDDSEFATLALREAGVSPEKLFVYVAGMNEWAANALPIEVGARNSGSLRNPKP